MICKSDILSKVAWQALFYNLPKQDKGFNWQAFFALFLGEFRHTLNLFQPSMAFFVETSNLFCSANQVIGFYLESNNGLT